MTAPRADVMFSIITAIDDVRSGRAVDFQALRVTLAHEDEKLELLAEADSTFDPRGLRGFVVDMEDVLRELEENRNVAGAEKRLLEAMEFAVTGR